MHEIIYENEGTFGGESGSTILETSLQNSIPHMHVCGGNARCSTCRILVTDGESNLTEPTEEEKNLARKKGFEPGIRLACQTRINGSAKIRRLVLDDTDAEIVASSTGIVGREETLAILFSDLRDFTSLAERQLPYDIVHILNRYFRAMGQPIIQNGGRIDKYIGDGLLALFGTDGESDAEICHNAARAAVEMQRALDDVNEYVGQHFGETLRMGIGLHFGRVILGEVGHPRHREGAALGDAINTASRVQSITRRANASILASEEFMEKAKDSIRLGRVFSTSLKGKEGRFKLYELTAYNDNVSDVTFAVRRQLKEKMSVPIAPAVLRLAFYEAMTRGSYSSVLRDEKALGELLAREENRGLDAPVAFMNECIDTFTQRGLALPKLQDLIFMAGAVAVEITGGPFIPVQFPIQKRRSADPRAQLPGIPRETEVFSALLIRFRRIGLDRRQLVALCGAHTLGKAHGRPFTENPFRFDNDYFRRLHREDLSLSLALLPSDRELIKDERARAFVEAYAQDEKLFFHDFRDAYTTLIQS